MWLNSLIVDDSMVTVGDSPSVFFLTRLSDSSRGGSLTVNKFLSDIRRLFLDFWS